MEMKDTGTCGVEEICGLSGYSTPGAAMKEFCRLNLRKKPKYHNFEFDNPGQLYCFYLFTASLDAYQGPYGDKFAKLINEEGLGKVVAAVPTVNKAFHPEHKNQAWLWSPDAPALEVWFDKQKAQKEK